MLQFIFLVLFGNLHTREYLHIIIQFVSIQIQPRPAQARPGRANRRQWQQLASAFVSFLRVKPDLADDLLCGSCPPEPEPQPGRQGVVCCCAGK